MCIVLNFCRIYSGTDVYKGNNKGNVGHAILYKGHESNDNSLYQSPRCKRIIRLMQNETQKQKQMQMQNQNQNAKRKKNHKTSNPKPTPMSSNPPLLFQAPRQILHIILSSVNSQLGILQKIHTPNNILSIARVELQNLLDLIEGQEINRQRLLADDPLDGLRARWGSERTLITIPKKLDQVNKEREGDGRGAYR